MDVAVGGDETAMMEELPAFMFGISGVDSPFEIPKCASARCSGVSLSAGTERLLYVYTNSPRTVIMIHQTWVLSSELKKF